MLKPNKYNKFFYLLLMIFHSSLLFYTFYKNKDRKRLFILLMSNIGLAYLLEYFVVNLFKGYSYRTNLMKNKYLDKIVGAIFSQAIYVPFTALFISGFQLGWKVKLLVTLYFGIVEEVFVRLRFYKQYWWKTTFTVTLLPIYFLISDKWYKHLKSGTPIILFFSTYHLILVAGVNILFIRAVLGKIKFGFGRFNSWKEHFIIVPLYSIVLSLYSTWVVQQKGNFSGINIFCFRLFIDFILTKIRWLWKKSDAKLSNLLFHLFMTILATISYKLVYKKKELLP